MSCRRLHVSFALACVLSSALLLTQPIDACGGKAITPSCGRTVVITGSTPDPILMDGGTFDFKQLVYFGIVDFPPGAGVCPPGPFVVDVDLTITCTPSGDAAGSVTDLPIVPGYTEVDVSVTVPAGVPRICSVESTATVRSTDGAEVTGEGGGQVVCIVEPSAIPAVPRLDLQLLDDPLARIHPGDQSEHGYRITNNDPTATFVGELEVQTQNRSKVPGFVDVGIPGDGVFSPSDPGDADNFPIAFASDVAACVPLPPDPLSATIPIITQPITLLPGESTVVEVLTRPWGMCSDGSCSQSRAVLSGDFSDVTSGLACSSFVTATDLTVPPSYLWPDTGATALVQPLPDPFLGEVLFLGEPLPLPIPDPLGVIAGLNQPQFLPPIGDPIFGQLFAEALAPERARLRSTFPLGQPVPLEDPFQVILPIQFFPEPEGQVTGIELLDVFHMDGAPIGFENFQPLFMGTLQITRLVDGSPFQTLMDFTLQAQLFGLQPQGLIDPLPIVPQLLPPSGPGFELGLQALVIEPRSKGDGPTLYDGVQVDLDLRMHAYRGAGIFADGFESGDTAAWTAN